MKVTKSAVLVALAMSVTGVAMASTGGTGILGTRHDFATRSNFLGTQTNGLTNGLKNQVGLCSFCHTPHSALSTALLWNKTASAQTFTWDDDTTTGGTDYATMAPGYKGASVKCLACHDATVAVGDVNLYKGKTTKQSDITSVVFNTFKVGDLPGNIAANADFTAGKSWTAADQRPQFIMGGTNGLLSNNHPVGMAYPYGQATNTYNGTTTGGEVVLSEFVANPHQVTPLSLGGGISSSGVAKGGGTADSLIKLYNETTGGVMVAGPAAGKTGMECSTCHDPHNKQTVDDWMLRAKAQGSTVAGGYICIQCHIK